MCLVPGSNTKMCCAECAHVQWTLSTKVVFNSSSFFLFSFQFFFFVAVLRPSIDGDGNINRRIFWILDAAFWFVSDLDGCIFRIVYLVFSIVVAMYFSQVI